MAHSPSPLQFANCESTYGVRYRHDMNKKLSGQLIIQFYTSKNIRFQVDLTEILKKKNFILKVMAFPE